MGQKADVPAKSIFIRTDVCCPNGQAGLAISYLAYAVSKTLVVLLEGGGELPWYSNKVAQGLPKPLHFGAVWVVGLLGRRRWRIHLQCHAVDEEAGAAYIWRVRIASDFDKWTVSRIQ